MTNITKFILDRGLISGRSECKHGFYSLKSTRKNQKKEVGGNKKEDEIMRDKQGEKVRKNQREREREIKEEKDLCAFGVSLGYHIEMYFLNLPID